MAAPVLRSVGRLVGTGLPLWRSSIGLGSNVSTCDGPPFMNRWTTRLARASQRRRLGQAAGSARRSMAARAALPRRRRRPVPRGPTRSAARHPPACPPSARAPIPMPDRQRSSRRVMTASSSRGAGCDIGNHLFARDRPTAGARVQSIHKHKFVGQAARPGSTAPRAKAAARSPSAGRLPGRRGASPACRRTNAVARASSSPLGRPAQDAAIQPAHRLARSSLAAPRVAGSTQDLSRQAAAPARAGTGCSSGRGLAAARSSRIAGGWSRPARRSRRCGRRRQGSGGR